MKTKNLKLFLSILIFAAYCEVSICQEGVPLGIYYQAVARDYYGKELVNKDIDVRFSIISHNPLGTIVYQELHSKVVTSKYGVFSLIIGNGTPTGGIYGELSQIKWSQAYHYLKVEVKFENTFIDMGTMQFLAVPYALFAQKSLEPGPEGQKGDQGLQGIQGTQGLKGDTGPQGVKGDTGPQGSQGVQGQKGDAGDPASDDQTLSFDGTNLSISVGNGVTPSTVNLSTLNVTHSLSILGDTLSIFGGNKVGLPNQIQDLHLDPNNLLKIDKNPNATVIDLTKFLDDKQQLSFNSADSTLSITNGTTPVDLSIFNQKLSFNPSDNKLSISGGSHPVDLTVLKNDADADPANEIQDIHLSGDLLTIDKNGSSVGVNLDIYRDNTDNQALTYNADNSLTITNGNTVSLGSMVAFRSKKTASISASQLTEVTFIPDLIAGTDEFNDGSAFNRGTGEFVAPVTGIYTFYMSYFADGAGGSRKLIIYYNTSVYEEIAIEISAGTLTTRSITMRLSTLDVVKLKIYTGMATQTGTGSFSGFRVY